MNLELVNPTPEYFGHNIRVLVDKEMNNAPWFVAADLCVGVGIVKANAGFHLKRLLPEDKGHTSIVTLGGPQKMAIVSEAGFYEFVLGSRKQQALEFKRWVCREVLPSIRKYGKYEAYIDDSGNPVDIPDVMVEMVRTIPFVDTEREKRIHVWEWLEEHDMADMQLKHRQALGKIARRFLHTNNLPVLSRWGALRANKKWDDMQTGRVYPPQILEMAYEEFLKGMKD